MLKVILIDDEPLAREGLRDLLRAHPSLQIVGEAGNASAAEALVAAEQPDAAFLDINMPRKSGFEFLKDLKVPLPVIFVTAHSEYAVQAFEVQAVDYLLKPLEPLRLAAAVARLEDACGRTEPATPAYEKEDRICLRTPQRTVIARLNDMVTLEAEGDFTRIHLANEAPLLICQTLGHYEKTLPAPPFLRLSRKLIINTRRLRKTEPLSRDETLLTLEGLASPVTIGRRAAVRLKPSK
jgi:two-component system LytT family response regulator